MKRSASALIVVGVMALCSVNSHQTSAKPPEVSAPHLGPHATKVLMRRKLDYSQQALEGLTSENFEMIRQAAGALKELSGKKNWDVIDSPEYMQFSTEYRRLTTAMEKAAEKKNLDGAALAYTQLTMNCLNCHKFTRGIQLTSSK